ncbi:MAG: FUSC family protein [Clostridia bacterium]
MQNKQYSKIGMRTIKTAVSVLLCLSLNRLFCYIYSITTAENLMVDILKFIFVREEPIYACIAAIIAMQSTVHGTVSKGVSRVVGTLLGGFIGIIFLAIHQYFSIPALEVVLSSLGVVLCFHICNLLDTSDSGPISCVVLLIIMITSSENTPLYYALDRVIDTFGGILVAVFVNRFLHTPYFLFRRREEKSQPTHYISTQKFDD